MKKLVTFVLAAVTALSMTCTAFAAPSPSAVGSVSTTGAKATINGKEVDVKVAALEKGTVPSVEELEKAAGIDVANATILGAVDISIDGVSADNKATVTVNVAGVTTKTTLKVLHLVNGAWKVETSEVGNGTVTIKELTSCSPFVFVADSKTVTAETTTPTDKGNGTTSPKTGETAAMPVAALVCALAMAGVVLVSKKRRA